MLAANHDKFPVMVNERKLREFEARDKEQASEVQALGNLVGLDLQPPPPPDDGMLDSTHCVMTPETHLNFLADWIDLQEAIFSPGDLLMDIGGFLSQYAFIFWLAFVLNDYARRDI